MKARTYFARANFGPRENLGGVLTAGVLEHEAFGRRMDQIRAGHDLLQTLDARLGHFQILRFGDPDKIAIGEPLEYIEHNRLVPPALVASIFDAKRRAVSFLN
jgi:hypothetical protein